jgi:transcriptional regulator with XRE-family HTH domain
MDIKRIIKNYGMSVSSVADKIGISQSALSQQINNNTISVSRCQEIAEIIKCPLSELVGDEIDNGFVSFIRYKGIHYTADNIKEFFKQVEEIKSIAK